MRQLGGDLERYSRYTTLALPKPHWLDYLACSGTEESLVIVDIEAGETLLLWSSNCYYNRIIAPHCSALPCRDMRQWNVLWLQRVSSWAFFRRWPDQLRSLSHGYISGGGGNVQLWLMLPWQGEYKACSHHSFRLHNLPGRIYQQRRENG